MLRLIGIIFRYEFIQNGKRKPYLFFTVIIPLLGLIGFSLFQAVASSVSSEKVAEARAALEDYKPIGVIDQSGLFGGPVPSEFGGKVILYSDEEEAQQASKDGAIIAYYIIPEDYLDSGKADRLIEQFSLDITDIDLFQAFLLNKLLEDTHTAQIFVRLQNPVTLDVNQINDTGDVEARNSDSDFAVVYLFSITFLMTVFSSSRYLMQSVVEERETRMIEIILSSVPTMPLLIGKILAQGLLGLIQMTALLGTGGWILVQLAQDVPELESIELSTTTLAITTIYFLGGYLLFGTLFAGIGAISTSMREGPQLATLFTMPAVVPMWLTVVFAQNPNGTLPVVLSMLPLTSPLSMIMRASVVSIPAWQLVISLTVLILSIVFGMWFAGRLFRVRTLLSGNRPRLVDLPRLLLGK